MKRVQAVLALMLFLTPSACDRGVTEPESLGPDVPDPSFSVKGKTGEIVYTGGSLTGNDLFLLDLNLKTVTNLTGGSGVNQMAEWSPSGDSLVYSAGPVGPMGVRELRLMWQSGGSFYIHGPFLAGPPCFGSQSFPAWSPNGMRLAYICSQGLGAWGHLWIADLNSIGVWESRPITGGPFRGSRPTWWNNDKVILPVLNPDGQGNVQRDLMWFTVPPAGSPPGPPNMGPVTATLDVNEDNPSWKYEAGVGNVIVYNETHDLGDPTETSDVYSFIMGINAAGDPDPAVNSGWAQLTTSGTADYPSWTPDGGDILYVDWAGGDLEVFQMLASGAKQKNLTNSPKTWELWAKRRPN